MNWLNTLRENLQSGYDSFDTAIGGVLPGGAPSNLNDLVNEVARDAGRSVVPWAVPAGVSKVVSGVNPGAEAALVDANLSEAGSKVLGAGTGNKAREHVVEEIMEKLGKQVGKIGLKKGLGKVGGRFASAFIPGAQGVAIADTFNDIGSLYSTVLGATTGRSLEDHLAVADSIKRRNVGTDAGLASISPTFRKELHGPSPVSADPINAQWGQGNPNHNFAVQEALNRVHMFKENFNPLVGDWGVTELAYGDTDSNNYLKNRVLSRRLS